MSSPTMSDPKEALERLKDLLAKATPLPWIATDRKTGAARIDILATDGPTTKEASHVARCGGKPPSRPMLSELDTIYEGNRIAAEGAANAALIVAAVNALPTFIAEREGLEREVGKLNGGFAPDGQTWREFGLAQAEMRGIAESKLSALEEAVKNARLQEESVGNPFPARRQASVILSWYGEGALDRKNAMSDALRALLHPAVPVETKGSVSSTKGGGEYSEDQGSVGLQAAPVSPSPSLANEPATPSEDR